MTNFNTRTRTPKALFLVLILHMSHLFSHAVAETYTSHGIRRLEEETNNNVTLTEVPSDAPTLGATTAVPTFTATTPAPTKLPTLEPSSAPTIPLATEAPTSRATTTSPTQAPIIVLLPVTATPTIPTEAPQALPATGTPTIQATTDNPTLEPTSAPTDPSPVSSLASTGVDEIAPSRPPMVGPTGSLVVGDGNDNQDTTNDDKLSLVYKISAAVGAAVIVLSLAILLKCYCNRRSAAAGRNGRNGNDKSLSNGTDNSGNSPELWLPHIEQEDVSTLGDPIGTTSAGVMRLGEDEGSLNTASLDRMLDGHTVQTTRTNSQQSFHMIMDPGECFDVRVPAGKLGVILEESAEDGVPIVHDIKQNSPLAGRITKGDRLCSVDGVDCTGKSARSVAKLLKFREDAPSRILTFSRPSPC